MLTILRRRREGMERVYAAIMLLMNVLSLVLGMIYLNIGGISIFWNVCGGIMLISLFGNIRLATIGQIKSRLNEWYLFVTFLFLMAIMIINTIVSCTPTKQHTQSNDSTILLLSLFILGGAIAAERLQNKSSDEISLEKEQGKTIGRSCYIIKNTIIILLSIVIYIGFFLAINLLRVHKLGLLEVFISEFAIFYAIAFLSVGVLILKLMNKKKFYLYYSIVLAITIFIFIVFLLPVFSIPSLLKNAKSNYTKAFGAIEEESDYPNGFFRPLPFSIPEYFFGTPSEDYLIKEHVLFYQGVDGIDEGLELYFDVYTPATDGSNLPGGNSVLIRIHGGGWTSGDKGFYNYAQMNKYFAAQGYIVFDIQYGLNQVIDWIDFAKVDKTLLGDYSIDDMVRHIGLFTKYLADHNTEYQANLNSVFLSGGSAGGQLALASGLAITDGGYRDIFAPEITIKGLIPFYPANGISEVLNIGGKDELVDPIALVDKKSPPCLIYQGSHDGIVSHTIVDEFQEAYLDQGNEKCAVLTMPFAGHSSDLYFAGYYNQVFVYYMERFMYQYR